MVQNLQRAADRSSQAELAIDLSNIIGRLPSRGYLIISDLPDGARLSNGHDNGDTTWTLMFDELSGLKFLPGPTRGVVSLKAEIFNRDAGEQRSAQIRRQVPLVLHTDDGVLWTPPARVSDASGTQAAASDAGVDRAEALGDHQNASGGPTRPSSRQTAMKSGALSDTGQCGGGHGVVKKDPKAPLQSKIALPPSESGAGQPVPAADEAGDGRVDAVGSARLLSKAEQRWTEEVDRLLRDAIAELRQEAEEALMAAEQRRVAELKELSGAIMKQHEMIAVLREEAEQSKEEAVTRFAEAEQRWKQAEAQRMKTARHEWSREKEGLTREAAGQKSRADELAAAFAALKAESESERQAFELRSKEAAAEAERSLQSAGIAWKEEVARCLDTAGLQIRAVFEQGALSRNKAGS